MVDKLAVAGNNMSVWNDKINNDITIFPRDVYHDKIKVLYL